MVRFFVTIFILLLSVKISDAKLVTILILGDSLTEGYGVEVGQTFGRLLEKKLNEQSPTLKNKIKKMQPKKTTVKKPSKKVTPPNTTENTEASETSEYKVLIGGIGGATSASALARLKWHLKTKIDWLIIALGANDGLRGLKPKQIQKSLNELINYAKENKLTIVLTGMKAPPNYGPKYRAQFENIFKTLSKKWKVPFFPFLLEGVAGEADKNIEDGIHPNAKGHAQIAQNLFVFLQKNIGLTQQVRTNK